MAARSRGQATVGVYLLTVGLSAGLWAVSLVVPSPRYVLWGIAVLVSAAGPVLATLRSDKVPLQIEHLPERFALLVILVLGEAVGSAARGVHDASWAPTSIGVGVLAFAVAAGTWWIYFDITAPSSARELQRVGKEEAGVGLGRGGGRQPRQRRPARPVRLRSSAVDVRHRARRGLVWRSWSCTRTRRLLWSPAGCSPRDSLYLAGVALVISGTTQTVRSIWPWPVAAIPMVLLGAVVPFPGSLLLTATYTVGILLLAAHGTRASRRPDTALAGAD